MAGDKPADRLAQSRWTKLNIASLLVQAGLALRKGKTKRAALLFGTATLAARHRGLSYAVQGALTANDIRKKLTTRR